METSRIPHRLTALLPAITLGVLLAPGQARAVTTVFFDSSQGTNLVASGTTSDTISNTGYTLQSASSLPARVWSAVTNTVAVNGDLFTVQVEVTPGSERLFRLQK